jgi:cation diffusion facilitator family transporter
MKIWWKKKSVSSGDFNRVAETLSFTALHLLFRDRRGKLWEKEGGKSGAEITVSPFSIKRWGGVTVHTESIEKWMHDHTFGQDRIRAGERRTVVVIIITAMTMALEITAGIAFGSMALLADGLHMGSHASALAVSAFAYYYTRRHADNPRFNFGTGKINSLAAFTSAVMLVLFATVMLGESLGRFIRPVPIDFNPSIFVAVAGLIVNGICLFVLGGHGHSHVEADHDHGSPNATDHDSDHHLPDAPHSHSASGHTDARHKDLNLRAAYLHVLADALTSFLAIFALLGGKYLGQNWLDPFMGVAGAALVIRWSWGLLRASTQVLLDMQAPDEILEKLRSAIESQGDSRISDLHVWAVGQGIYAAQIALVSSNPLDTEAYYHLLPKQLGIVHLTIETRQCSAH